VSECSSVAVSCCCEKLVAETRGQFGNSEEKGKSAVGSRYQKAGEDTGD
jgi:hypothetical protein